MPDKTCKNFVPDKKQTKTRTTNREKIVNEMCPDEVLAVLDDRDTLRTEQNKLRTEIERLRNERDSLYRIHSGALEDVMGLIGELAWGIELPIVAVSCTLKNGTCETHALQPDSSKPFFEAIHQKLKLHTPLGKFTRAREDEELRLRAALYQIVESAAPRRCLVKPMGEPPCGECPVCVALAALEMKS